MSHERILQLLDYKKIIFKDNMLIPTQREMNCIQFCVVYLMAALEINRINWISKEYNTLWYMGKTPLLIDSISKFLAVNPSIRLVSIRATPPYKNNTLMICRIAGEQLHHAGIYSCGHIIHCCPDKNVTVDKLKSAKDCINLELKKWHYQQF